MMRQDVIIAGFGGQGVLVMGQLLAYAGLLEGKQVAWVPSYGPEMRGGTANCSVIIADQSIGSPLVEEPGVVLIFNQPSLDKFERSVRNGGILLFNSSMINRQVNRKELQVYGINANKIANELGSDRVANMVLVGAYLESTGVVSINSVMTALSRVLPKHRQNLLDINRKAAEMGVRTVRRLMAAGHNS